MKGSQKYRRFGGGKGGSYLVNVANGGRPATVTASKIPLTRCIVSLLICELAGFIADVLASFVESDFKTASNAVKRLNFISFEVSLIVEKPIRVFAKQ